MSNESQITTDRAMVQGWCGEHDAIPVRYAGTEGESGRLRIVPGSQRSESAEELDWDEFFTDLNESDSVVVYHGDQADREPFEVLRRDEAVERAALETEDVEQTLLAGETVTSEITETVVIEETVVEEATVESEVIDREVIEEEIVDAELLTREVTDCNVRDRDSSEEAIIDLEQFDVGYQSPGEFDVEVEVTEGWSVTKELLEQLSIESRIVDTAAAQTDTVVADSIDIQGVQQSILESNLVDSELTPGEVMESHAVESSFGEDNTIRTQVLERKTVDEEVSLRKRLTGEITEAETLTAESIRRETLESRFIDEDIETGAHGEFTEAEITGVEPAGNEAVSADASGGEAAMERRTIPTEDDEGKAVVGADGDELGMVYEVKGDTMYVDPHPSLTDRIKAALDWGDIDEDMYPVTTDQIRRIDDDRVELLIEGPDEPAR